MYGGDCDAAIAKAAAAVTPVQSQSQEVGSSGEGLDLYRAIETSPLLSTENCKTL